MRAVLCAQIWANQWYTAMLDAAVPNIEMHLYGSGVHGAGQGIPLSRKICRHAHICRQTCGSRVDWRVYYTAGWTDRFVEWFEGLGFLAASGVPTKAARDVHAFATNPQGRRTRPGQPPAGDSLGLSDSERSGAAGNFGTGTSKQAASG